MDTMMIIRNLDDMQSPLDQLSLVGRELTDDELDQAADGFLLLLAAFAYGFALGFSGAMLVDGLTP